MSSLQNPESIGEKHSTIAPPGGVDDGDNPSRAVMTTATTWCSGPPECNFFQLPTYLAAHSFQLAGVKLLDSENDLMTTRSLAVGTAATDTD